ncbi:Cof-type HAD-IIB family hydrolase [Kosmotoga pacifica]|uniref:Haloacid dehalogenase n=1 Tax=Kosmotoga pacifica TaxID=1330330 RepID=A0A0G2Z959_9BACT|nr:Cof-type HAD-IIB family hydrolase [Kosmotoga pacifica]AKI98140.1 hypothetical protein IX53_10220 [Kosmotoga pacifica]
MIKLIIIDLDGTLLSCDKKISKDNLNSLKRAMNSGVAVTISTGRSFISARDYVDHLGLEVPVSFQNGALVIKCSNGKKEIIRQVLLASDWAKKIIEKSRERGVTYILFRDFFECPDMYMESVPSSPYESYYENNRFRIRTVKDPLEYIKRDGVAEVALEGPEEKILDIIRELNPDSSVSIIKNNNLENHSFYEFFGPAVGKAMGLKFLMKHFGIGPKEVAYIGDNFNDIDVMKEVGLPIAMANAPDEVKKYAKYVTESDNDNNGVAEAIIRILEGEIR